VRPLIPLLGLPPISPRRLALGALLLLVALALVIVGALYLVQSVDRALVRTLDPPLASLLTGLIVLVAAGAIGAIGFVYLRPRPAPRPAPSADPSAEIVAQIFTLVRRNPGQAALIAAIAGLVVGAVPELRRAMEGVLKPGPSGRPDRK
jgi:hypothetical protein